MRPAGDFTLVPPGTRPHCFEIITGTMCYFVGEDPNMHAPTHASLPQASPPSPSNVAPNSGVGREVAKAWESAIRQALMPIIFQDAPPAEGHTPHSKGRGDGDGVGQGCAAALPSKAISSGLLEEQTDINHLHRFCRAVPQHQRPGWSQGSMIFTLMPSTPRRCHS